MKKKTDSIFIPGKLYKASYSLYGSNYEVPVNSIALFVERKVDNLQVLYVFIVRDSVVKISQASTFDLFEKINEGERRQ